MFSDSCNCDNKYMSKMSVFRFGAVRSPPRRPTIQGSEQSPFCTSPSQLQEVTMDPSLRDSLPFAVGLRSPGKSSPIRGRTMKEYEEQLVNLQKENFNLKLRIYFAEQRLTGNCDEDSWKKNIELQTKLEEMKKERDVKQELLCQAASAISLMQKEHQEQREMLENRIREMEKELSKSLEKSLSQPLEKPEQVSDQTIDISKDVCIEQLREHISRLEEEILSLKTRYNCDSLGQVNESSLTCDPVQNEMKSEAKLHEPCNESESVSQSDFESNDLVLLVERLHDVTGKLKELEEKCKVTEEKNSEYEKKCKKVCMGLQNLTNRYKCVVKENEQLKLELERRTSSSGTNNYKDNIHADTSPFSIGDVETSDAENNQQLQVAQERKSLSLETEQQMQSLLKTLQEKEVLLQEYERKLCATTSELEARDNHIFELKNSINFLQETKTHDANKSEGQSDEVLSEISTLVNVVESKTRAMLSVEIEEKNEEIKRLNTELRKRTTNLQELVNKELWDKNREIEKLQDRLNNICKVKEVEIVSLLQQLSDKESKLTELQKLLDSFLSKEDQAVSGGCELPVNVSKCNCSMLQQNFAALTEEKRILSNKVKELEEIVCNTPERDESKMVKDLRALCMEAKKEKEFADKRCEDAREGIRILTSRLEELASFLNWLLKNRDALGSLGTRKCDVLKQAIENSMELSRRLSKSFAAYGTGFEDSSFQEIDSLSNILMCSNISDVGLREWWKDDFGESKDQSSDHKKISSLSLIPENQEPSVSVKTNVTQINYGSDKKTPKLIATNSEGQNYDLINFVSPPQEKGNFENCENSMVNSMTFYNSRQTPRKDSLEKSIEVNDKTVNRTTSQNTIFNSILIFDNFRNIHPAKSVSRVSPVKEYKSLTEIGTSAASEVKNIHNKENVGNQAFYAGNSLNNVSDSESWSEPDRNVSLARIGLHEDQVKNISPVSSGTGNPNISRNRRIKEFGDSSESSEETAREDTRTPLLKRSKSDSGDMKRAITRLQQANDAMKVELNIFYKWKEALRLSRDRFNVVCFKCHSAAENRGNFVLLPINELDVIRCLRQQLEYSIQKNNCLYLQAISNTSNNQAGFEIIEPKRPLEQFQMKMKDLEKKLDEANLQVEESKRIKEQHDITLKDLQMANSKIVNLEKQITDLQITLGQEKENESLEKQCLILELENKAKERNIEMEKKLHAEIVLRNKAETKIKELEEIKVNLSSTVNLLEQEVQEIVEKIRDKKPESNEKSVQSVIENANATKLEIEQFKSQVIELVKERDMLKQNLESIKEMVQLKEEELDRAYKAKYIMKIKEIEEESIRKMNENEQMWKEKDWVQKTEIEKKNMENIKLIEIEQGLRKKIDVLEQEKKVVQAESSKSIENLKVKESELLHKFKDLERTLREMESDFKRQLDNAELVTSEVALEKTKLLNEKLILEKEIRKLESQYAEIVQTKAELENQLQTSRKQFHEQIATCEKQKSELLKRTQDLELVKSTLEEKIVSLQEADKYGITMNSHSHRTDAHSPGLRTEVASTGSLPSSLWSDFLDRRTMTTSGSMAIPQHPYSRQCSDISDYLSEDQQIDESGKMVGRSSRIWSGFGSYQHDIADSLIDVAATRNMNSSPDLGIESDQGRFSSLEAGISQSFPLVQLDKSSFTNPDNSSALVLKTNFNDELSKLEAENVELKKRLVYTRKALEKTVDQLKSANQRKKLVEKAICSQLHKTNHILKQSRANLEHEAASIKED